MYLNILDQFRNSLNLRTLLSAFNECFLLRTFLKLSSQLLMLTWVPCSAGFMHKLIYAKADKLQMKAWAPAGMGMGALVPSPGNVVIAFGAANVVWSLIRRNIYALFWENVEAPRPPPLFCPWTSLGDFRPSDPVIAQPWKKSCGHPWMPKYNFMWLLCVQ